MRLPSPVTSIALAAVAVVMLACSGTTSEPSDGTPQSPGTSADSGNVAVVKPGQKITVKTIGGNSYEVTVADVKTGVKSNNEFIKPKNGQFITFKATIKVIEGQTFGGPMNFHLETADKKVYDWALMASINGVEQDWGGQVNAGQTRDGHVVLDVPKDLKGARIFVQEFDKPGGYWTL